MNTNDIVKNLVNDLRRSKFIEWSSINELSEIFEEGIVSNRKNEIDPITVSNAANVISKIFLADPKNKKASRCLGAIAGYVLVREDIYEEDGVLRNPFLEKSDARAVATIANAVSKLPLTGENGESASGCLESIAGYVKGNTAFLDMCDQQHIANIANAVSKIADSHAGQRCLRSIAGYVSEEADLLNECKPHEMSMFANAVSKVADSDAGKRCLRSIAGHVHENAGFLNKCDSQAIANIANAVSKLPLTGKNGKSASHCLERIAGHVNGNTALLNTCYSQHIANIANAVSKVADSDAGQRCLRSIAGHVSEEADFLNKCRPQEMSMFANAASKIADSDAGKRCLKSIAGYVNKDTGFLNECEPQNIANIANAVSKVANSPAGQRCLRNVARHVHEKAGFLNKCNSQAIANIANAVNVALLKGEDGKVLKNCLIGIARYISEGNRDFTAHAESKHRCMLTDAMRDVLQVPLRREEEKTVKNCLKSLGGKRARGEELTAERPRKAWRPEDPGRNIRASWVGRANNPDSSHYSVSL